MTDTQCEILSSKRPGYTLSHASGPRRLTATEDKLYVFDDLISDHDLSPCGSFLAPSHEDVAWLIKQKYLVFDRSETLPHGTTRYWYKHTPEGLSWWVEERLLYCSQKKDYYSCDPADLTKRFEGKGVGCHARVCSGSMVRPGVCVQGAVFAALSLGYVEFVSHTDYCARRWGLEEYITVALTNKGMEFFDSLPKLALECA